MTDICTHCELPPARDGFLSICGCCSALLCSPQCAEAFHVLAASAAVAYLIRARKAEHLAHAYRVQLEDREVTIRKLVELATRIMGGEPATFEDGLVMTTGRLQCSEVLVTAEGKAVWQQRERAA